MKIIDHIYVNGAFVKPHGTELFEIRNPATAQVIGRLTLGDQEDTRHAIAAAKEAFATFSQTGKEERITLLKRLHDTVLARADDLREATIEEYGAPLSRAT
jgi:aldehyde dehydrogenase (NAD+)